jgi:hypothetical protein
MVRTRNAMEAVHETIATARPLNARPVGRIWKSKHG